MAGLEVNKQVILEANLGDNFSLLRSIVLY